MGNLIPLEVQIQRAKAEILACGELNRQHGLRLTEEDVADLVEQRGSVLKATGRVEFGGGILPKLMAAFCDSAYVDRENYAAVLGELQEAFYYFKTESRDQFSDDELLDFMARVFNGEAAGSAEFLTAISLEELCRWARNMPDRYGEEEAFW